MIRNNFRRVMFAVAVISGGLQAQATERVLLRPSAVLSAKDAGALLRIAARQPNRRLTGKLVDLDDASLTIERDGARTRVAGTDVDTLWVGHRSTGRGVLIGGVVSAIALSIAACQPTCEESGVIFPGLLITPLPGVIVGAIIGHRIIRWKPQWP